MTQFLLIQRGNNIIKNKIERIFFGSNFKYILLKFCYKISITIILKDLNKFPTTQLAYNQM
jgi:hypothetical protein